MFKRYVRRVQRRFPLFLLLSLALAVLTYVIMVRLPITYEVHYSAVVSLALREEPAEYTFDGYYALQATELFAATLAGWTEAPEVIVQAYQAAQVPVPRGGTRALRRGVSATKTAPQLIEIVVTADDRERAERLGAGLRAVSRRNLDLYHDNGIPALRWRVVTTEPWTSVTYPAGAPVAVAVFIVTLLLLINGAVLWESVQDADRD